LIVMNGSAFAGPDLICSEITSSTNFGFADGKVAYSFGTTLCNIGDAELPWDANTNQHPLISQTLYKLKDHQLTQIGIGFVRHTTIPLSSNACNLDCSPAGFDALGVGCSDTSSSVINGAQGLMGPRTEVNAFTGDYPYPFTAINQTGDAIYKRLRADLGEVSDPDSLYFVETQVIAPGEASDARANNASYRQVVFSPGSANATLVGTTYTEQPAIFAWRDHGKGIGVPDPSVMITQGTIPGDGIIHVGSRATDLGTGSYRYDYAVHNQNAENAILSLVVPGAGFFDGVARTTFHDVDYHDDVDGLLDSTDIQATTYSSINTYWRLQLIETLSNVIRWGTTYSYSFVVDGGNTPRTLHAVLEYDIPGITYTTAPLLVEAVVPKLGDACHADIIGDGQFDFHDISVFIGDFNAGDPSADFSPDGQYNFFDIAAFLNSVATECP